MGGSRLPRGEVALQPFEHEVHGDTDRGDGDDPEVHVGDQEAELGVDDQVAQPGLGAHHFSRDQHQHASRPYGQSAWDGKPAAVIGASVGAIGTALSQQHLRNILAYLNVPTLGQPEAFIHNKEGLYEADGSLSEGSRKFLQTWVDAYVGWVKKHA